MSDKRLRVHETIHLIVCFVLVVVAIVAFQATDGSIILLCGLLLLPFVLISREILNAEYDRRIAEIEREENWKKGTPK